MTQPPVVILRPLDSDGPTLKLRVGTLVIGKKTLKNPHAKISRRHVRVSVSSRNVVTVVQEGKNASRINRKRLPRGASSEMRPGDELCLLDSGGFGRFRLEKVSRRSCGNCEKLDVECAGGRPCSRCMALELECANRAKKLVVNTSAPPAPPQLSPRTSQSLFPDMFIPPPASAEMLRSDSLGVLFEKPKELTSSLSEILLNKLPPPTDSSEKIVFEEPKPQKDPMHILYADVRRYNSMNKSQMTMSPFSPGNFDVAKKKRSGGERAVLPEYLGPKMSRKAVEAQRRECFLDVSSERELRATSLVERRPLDSDLLNKFCTMQSRVAKRNNFEKFARDNGVFTSTVVAHYYNSFRLSPEDVNSRFKRKPNSQIEPGYFASSYVPVQPVDGAERRNILVHVARDVSIRACVYADGYIVPEEYCDGKRFYGVASWVAYECQARGLERPNLEKIDSIVFEETSSSSIAVSMKGLRDMAAASGKHKGRVSTKSEETSNSLTSSDDDDSDFAPDDSDFELKKKTTKRKRKKKTREDKKKKRRVEEKEEVFEEEKEVFEKRQIREKPSKPLSKPPSAPLRTPPTVCSLCQHDTVLNAITNNPKYFSHAQSQCPFAQARKLVRSRDHPAKVVVHAILQKMDQTQNFSAQTGEVCTKCALDSRFPFAFQWLHKQCEP